MQIYRGFQNMMTAKEDVISVRTKQIYVKINFFHGSMAAETERQARGNQIQTTRFQDHVLLLILQVSLAG